MDYRELINSPGMWVAASGAVILGFSQAAIYFIRAYRAALEMGFSSEVLHKSIRSAAVTAIGPSAANGVGLVALMAIIGGPISWQRFTVIGALFYDLTNVELGMMALGATSATDMSAQIFTNVVWGVSLAACFWQVNVIFLCPSYEKILNRVTKGDEKVLSFVLLSVMMSIFSKGMVPSFLKISGSTYACIIGIVVMAFMVLLMKKNKKMKWLDEWTLPIAMLFGMFGALIFV